MDGVLNAPEFVEWLLDTEWREEHPSRDRPVPKPDIWITTDEETPSRISPEPGGPDVVLVRHNNSIQTEPKGAGYTHDGMDVRLTIDMRTANGRIRLVGEFDPTDQDAYGGVAGEVKRCLETVRRGEYAFDLVTTSEYRPLSEEIGWSKWRGVWEVELRRVAREIDP